MHSTHVSSPHHPSSSNAKKDHVSSPPPIGEASNNFSLLHDNEPNNSSLPLDEPSLDTKKVNGTSPSPTTQEHAYELRDFFDGGFSSIENYEMDLDAKDVSFKCVEKTQNNFSLIHGDDLFSPNKKKIKTSQHNENVPSNPSLPLDEAFVDTKKVNETSPSPMKHFFLLLFNLNTVCGGIHAKQIFLILKNIKD
jgi:hypothetical protein